MKSVLISIQPRWCELIASGQKTVEVRKTKPKLDVPFKVFIYETKNSDTIFAGNPRKPIHLSFGRGKIIGEFVCDKIITAKEGCYINIPRAESQIDALDLMDYADGKTVYGWHISDLVIYDKPRELSELRTPCKMTEGSCYFCDYAVHGMDGDLIDCNTSLTRPPQSWCYVESEE